MQGIIYTSPPWNKLSIGRKQRVKKSLHSSLQNQIHFTAVMVKKWGLSQSTFTSYQQPVGHQSSSGAVPHCSGTGTAESPGSTARHWHRAIQSNTPRAKGKHAGGELQGEAPAYGCGLAKLEIWTEESSQSDCHFWSSMLRVPRRQGPAVPCAARPAAENGRDLRVPLCFVSAWPSLTWQTLWKKTTTQQLAPPFTLPRSLEEQQRNVLSCNQYS